MNIIRKEMLKGIEREEKKKKLHEKDEISKQEKFYKCNLPIVVTIID